MIRLRVLTLFAAAVLLLAGCSGRSGGKTVDLVPADAAATLLEELTFPEELMLAENGAEENYYRLDDTVTDFAIYISSSGGTANEVTVLKVADPANLEGAKAILNKRLENLKFQFKDYVPAEMVKLEDPVIEAKGNVAIMVLSDDSAAARKAVKALLG